MVGAGAAGLYVALRAAETGSRVALVSRKRLTETVSESASYWAQGGLAAALGPDDSPDRHARDTLDAGRGLCRTAAVEALAREAPGAVAELVRLGVGFDTGPGGDLALALEGGHTARRIIHAGGSATGKALTDRLIELVAAEPRIEVLERTSALALWSDGERCAGVITQDGGLAARATVLATGGGAAMWSRTTNPWGAIGAGAVLAHAAGADLADLEFCQFHPTALALAGKHDGTLLTEALRGEGALAARCLRPPVHRRARPSGPGDGGDPRSHGRRRRGPRPARRPLDRPGALSERVRRLPGSGTRPRAGARPGRPGRPLPDGGHRLRPARTDHAPRSVRGGRVLVHRGSRSQPPGVEFAHRVLRVRRSRCCRRRDGARRRTVDARPGLALRAANRRHQGGGLASRGPAPGTRSPRETARRSVSARAAGRPRGARQAGVTRAHTAGSTSRFGTDPSTAFTW